MKQHNQLFPVLALCLFTAANTPAGTRYVDVNSASPTPPYTNWAAAATNIQDAVDAADPGDQILVTNGVYQTGGRAGLGRVVLKAFTTVQSVNGPELTIISGGGAERCAVLENGSVLSGFTLTNGVVFFGSGGGVAFADFFSDAVVSNCVIVGNSAPTGGGAASALVTGGNSPVGGTLSHCIISSNSAIGFQPGNPTLGIGGGADNCKLNDCKLVGNSAVYGGGGASASTLSNCILTGNVGLTEGGGGARWSTLNNCTLTRNSTGQFGYGGGTYYGTLTNCLLADNRAWNGGGALGGTLNNCTVTGNTAWGNNGSAGGVNDCSLKNCIVYYNTGFFDNYFTGSFNSSCTVPLPLNGSANITDAPLFVDQADGNLRLQSNSPCINVGDNSYIAVGTDLDGRPRIVWDTVDMGAYEYQPGVSSEFIGWLQEYGLRTDGSSDYVDSDSDLLNNWQEWIAGTIPTDPLSALRLLTPTHDASGVTVSWQSVSNRTYFLERATDLGAVPPFSLLASNIVGQAGTTSYTSTNAVGPGPFFFRVGVQ